MTPEPGWGASKRREFGVLLHATSLPGADDWGALGRASDHFLDWLQAAGASVWQLLPLRPVGNDGSPYYARSTRAGNARLIDVEQLVDAGLLAMEPRGMEAFGSWHARQVRRAAAALLARPSAAHDAFVAWSNAQRTWLEDYVLYSALSGALNGAPWPDWPAPLRDRRPEALNRALTEQADECALLRVEQYFFHTQWQALRRRAAAKGVRLFGDLPFYVAPDAVDVWVHRDLFQLDAVGRPTAVAGVPPDYFCADGQLWGNPLYQWERHEHTGFAWWLDRLAAEFELCDLVRIDHFRALEAYWSVPIGRKASAGEWLAAPGEGLLAAATGRFGKLALVAEDLGVITSGVEALRARYSLPGMRVMQFGFGGDADSPHLPHNWAVEVVAYSGTHDNDTLRGWLATLDDQHRHALNEYIGGGDLAAGVIRVLLGSVARLVILPMQDLVGLGSESRMNVPGTVGGNWSWRLAWSDVAPTLAARTRAQAACFGRR